MYTHIYIDTYGQISVGLYRGQKASILLDLESQIVGSHLTWELGTKFQSSVRAASADNSCTVYPAPQ